MTVQLAVITVLVFAVFLMVAWFEMFCLRDLAQTSDADLHYLTRQGWIVLIVVAIPLGGIVYLYGGRHTDVCVRGVRARSTGDPRGALNVRQLAQRTCERRSRDVRRSARCE